MTLGFTTGECECDVIELWKNLKECIRIIGAFAFDKGPRGRCVTGTREDQAAAIVVKLAMLARVVKRNFEHGRCMVMSGGEPG